MAVLVAGHGARVLCSRRGRSVDADFGHAACTRADGRTMIVAARTGRRPLEQAERHEEQEEQRDDGVCAARTRARAATGTRQGRRAPRTASAITRAVYGVGAQSPLGGIMHPRVDLHSGESRGRRDICATCHIPSARRLHPLVSTRAGINLLYS